MAIYVPVSRRRLRAVAIGVVALAVGLLVGVLAGRASITTTGERISRVRTEANDLATRVQALTIEYEQAYRGQGDTVQGGVLDALAGIDRDAAAAIADAPWLTAANRAAVTQALQQLRSSAQAKVDPQAFADETNTVAAVIHAQLGDEGQPPP
jgi:hypothetical protein